MSRHSRIVNKLHDLAEARIIGGYVRDSVPEEPARVRWIINIHADVLYFTTPEVEAFLEGVTVARRASLAVS